MFKAKCHFCNRITTKFIAKGTWYGVREYRSRFATFFLGPKELWLCPSCLKREFC